MDDAQRAEILKHEKWLEEVIRTRNPRKDDKWWLSPSAITGAVAVVSVVVSALLTFLTTSLAREREIELTRRDQVLQDERDLIIEVSSLLARLLKTTEDRLKMARGLYDDLTDAQLAILLNESNAVDDVWRQEREHIGARLLLYFDGIPRIVAGWDTTTANILLYTQCVERTYRDAQFGAAPVGACEEEQVQALERVRHLRESLIDQYRHDFALDAPATVARNPRRPQS